MVLGRLYILGASVRQRTGGSTTPPSPHCVCVATQCDPVAMSTHVLPRRSNVQTRELTLQRGHNTHSEGMEVL